MSNAIDSKFMSRKAKRRPHLIGAIDQGTSSTRFLVFENQTGRLVASSQVEINRIVPKEGWVEIEPKAIMDSVYATMSDVHQQLIVDESRYMLSRKSNSTLSATTPHELVQERLKCIGICNQRESTVVWDSKTGEPLYNVIVWMDNRTKDIVDQMIDSVPGRNFNWLKDKTGLPMSTYFSAFKLKWLIDNVERVKQALRDKRLLFGTVDSWILWNLTGNHMTDVSNASRTFLMDIESLEWDKTLCKLFNIPVHILPKILSSADNYGSIKHGHFENIPITGVIGDQSAALFGHNCLQLGQTKATFGTGCFIMQNIGPGPLNGALSGIQREAKRGLITTVGYKLGSKPVSYALEGSIKIAGAAVTWLRDNLQLIENYEECDHLVNMTTNAAGVFFVPALGGLYSPYWDPDAAGVFIGLSQFSRREHLVRATFDSIAYQTNDILSLMRGVTSGLMIDGGLCKSENMCQILADITGCDIVRPSMCETSALGAAMVAACGAGIWSYESMLANANKAAKQAITDLKHHHYPHESLHCDHTKMSSLITRSTAGDSSGSSSSIVNQVLTTTRTATTSGLKLSVGKLDTGGGVNDDAGGGGVTHRRQPSDGGNLSSVDESSVNATRTFNSDCDEEANVVGNNLPPYKTVQAHSNIQKRTQRIASPSSGYSSGGDNNTIVQSDLPPRRDTPVSLLPESLPESLLPDSNIEPHQLVDEMIGDESVALQVTDGIKESLTLDSHLTVASIVETTCDADNDAGGDQCSECDISSTTSSSDSSPMAGLEDGDDDDDDVEDDFDTILEAERGHAWHRESIRRHLDGRSKQVHVFQSFISLDHRTELVDTWHRAVERSMKWTKIHHEEVRRIDYQRLASLPISMYLFISVGIVALSNMLSPGGPGILRGFSEP